MDPHTSALADELGIPALLHKDLYVEALERLVPLLYEEGGAPQRRSAAQALREEIFAGLGEAMRERTHPPRTRMKFGTSGWRGLLLADFTVCNVQRVTQGLLDVLLGLAGEALPCAALGIADRGELRRRGCVVAHDTRFMGPELSAAVQRVLLFHGIPVVDLGMATTPEVSAALAETGAAFSINLTPSHNPFCYHGYKFNPADGGPATAELTAPIARRANEIIDGNLPVHSWSEAELAESRERGLGYRRADPVALYRAGLRRRLPYLDLAALIEQINARKLDLYIDNGFGATTGKYQELLRGVEPGRLHVYNPAPDYLFGGKSREPSADNFAMLQQAMAARPPAGGNLQVGIMNDGDGDRFLGGGRQAVLSMNRFGPLVVRYLSQRHGLRGDVTRSIMTSHMADAAQRRYLPEGRLHETRVGFQHLKAHVPTSVNSFEESDGMSPLGWSRDKDGILAGLLLCAMVLDSGQAPEELDRLLTEELGTFVFERKKYVLQREAEALARALAERFGALAPGQEVQVPGLGALRVRRVDAYDGIKVLFENGAWVGVRPSGTEPAVRVYAETYAPPGAAAEERLAAVAAKDALHAWAYGQMPRSA